MVETMDAGASEPEDQLVGMTDGSTCLVVVISTYTEGTPPESAEWFYKWLEESAKDFRSVPKILPWLPLGHPLR